MQRCEASAFRVRNTGGGVQGHSQRPERSEDVVSGLPFRFCLNADAVVIVKAYQAPGLLAALRQKRAVERPNQRLVRGVTQA